MPLQTDRFPAGFDYQARFPDLAWFAGLEGGSVYLGTDAGRPVVVTDESTIIELLDDDDAAEVRANAIAVHYFESLKERARYVERRYGSRACPEWRDDLDP